MASVENMEFRELLKEECIKLRSLWEEVFYEDSKEFTDYYFLEKARNNHAFAIYRDAEDFTAGYISMLHLSPNDMMIRVGKGFECREICYIVGVATKEMFRHRGYMNGLLKKAFLYMFGREQPFTFLMPASPKIYEPYQFVYIYDREEFSVTEHILPDKFIKVREIAEMAEYSEAYLLAEKDIFIKREEKYFHILIKELAAQKGGIYPLRESGKIDGYFLYAEEAGKGEIQEAVIKNCINTCPVSYAGRKTPAIMARIVNLESMLELLRTQGNEIAVTIKVIDPVITDNSGVWEWTVSDKKSHAFLIIRGDSEEFIPAYSDCEASIDRLASWIFGYKKTEDCFRLAKTCSAENRRDVMERLHLIKTFKEIFINEIV